MVGVTGTKGKSTTVEILASILEEAGYRVASLSTIRFRIDGEEKKNLFKMTVPGRFFVQKFLRQAVEKKCDFVVIEISSEAAKLYRNKYIDLDAVIVTNLAPEHIESHGSFEKYRKAKLSIARSLLRSRKKNTALILNSNDENLKPFFTIRVPNILPFSVSKLERKEIHGKQEFVYNGALIKTILPGEFNASNIVGAAACASFFHIPSETIALAVSKIQKIRGRMEEVSEGQSFRCIVDYAHTKESLEAVYKAISERKICVLGGTGGGRDHWKRPEMGKVANQYCAHIILTNEDPYGESPLKIIEEVRSGISEAPTEIILDRREAIREALSLAKSPDAVVITGKGTDPYIMEAGGKKTPWDDADVAREELQKLLSKRNEPARAEGRKDGSRKSP